MAADLRLIVGLGNPGPKFEGTRHNVGFEVGRAIVQQIGSTFKHKAFYHLAMGAWRGRKLAVALPQTYMNRSGLAVEELVRKLKVTPQDLLVIVDDIHIPLGKVRLREKGGYGGHNGMEDIGDWLDTNEFPRLRIGIGSEFEEGRQSDYVLHPFAASEREAVDEVVLHARDAALTFVIDGILTAMNRFNR